MDLRERHGLPPPPTLGRCPIHEQLDSRDVAAVIGGQERHGLGDLVGSTEATERHRGGDHLRALLACRRGGEQLVESGCVDGTRAHRVHPDAAILQVGRPRPRERATAALVALYTLLAANPLLPTIDALRMIDAPSGIRGSAFCTVKSSPFTLMSKMES